LSYSCIGLGGLKPQMDVLGKFLFPVRRDSGYQTPLLPLRELS